MKKLNAGYLVFSVIKIFGQVLRVCLRSSSEDSWGWNGQKDCELCEQQIRKDQSYISSCIRQGRSHHQCHHHKFIINNKQLTEVMNKLINCLQVKLIGVMKNVQHIIMLDNYEHPQNNKRTQTVKYHEILSKLISELSQMLNSILRLLIAMNQPNPLIQLESLSSFQNKLITCLFNLNSNPALKTKIIQDSPPNYNTLRRFSCRLIQNILPFKQRAENSEALKPMLGILSRIESSISSFQQSKNLSTFVHEVYQTFTIFLTYANKRSKKQQPEKLTKKGHSKQIENEKLIQSTNRESRSKSFQVEPEYQKKLRKLMTGLNERFKTVDCMELDYSYFRSSYFQGKNNSEFFDEYLGRNNTIDYQIKDYEKQYQSYIKRKEKRRTQRNFQIPLSHKLSLNKTYARDKSTDLFIDKFDNKSSLKINNWASSKQRSNRVEYKKYSLAQESNSFSISPLKDKQPNKIKYEIKNILISASKLKMQPYIVQKVNIKNTLRQLQASRRKYQKMDQKLFLKNIRQLGQKSGIAQL